MSEKFDVAGGVAGVGDGSAAAPGSVPASGASAPGEKRATILVRPSIPMGFIDGVPFVAALGAAEALGAKVAWPHAVVGEGGEVLVTVRARAGYDDQGLYAAVELSGPGADEAAADGAASRVEAWGEAVAAGSKAGPLAAILNDYFDACALMGKPAEVVRRDGSVACKGYLAGMDIWGKATVKLADGREVEVAPNQAAIRPA